MPQTKFVLRKSLELGLHPIVIINKIDKSAADPQRTRDQVYELFMDLGASDSQLDFTVVYAVGRNGVAKKNIDDKSKDLTPLLDTILEKVKPAKADIDVPFRFQAFNLGYDNFLGRLAIGRIYQGKISPGQSLFLKKTDNTAKSARVTKIFTFEGLRRVEVAQALAGDIVMISGFSDIDIGETLCETEDQEALPAITVDEPTILLDFMPNSSPFSGRDGKLVTNKQLEERLRKELEVNVGLRIDFSPEAYKVYGRGELHIAILLENMRREGYEIQVSQPKVIIKEKDGLTLEPFEEMTIDVPETLAGVVLEKIGKRKGAMKDMHPFGSHTRMVFEIPTRGLLGYRGEFVIDTKGEGILCSRVIGYRPHAGDINKTDLGSMVSMISGKTSAFSLWNLQARGILYIGPSIDVYEGMVIGNVAKGIDMTVNPIKGKELSNFRSARNDEEIQLTPPLALTIERGLEIMSEDEYLEITPRYVRLRKKYLTELDRKRAERTMLLD
jgi:GTP-binding protein